MIKIVDKTAMARSAEKPGASGVDVDSISPVEYSRIWPGIDTYCCRDVPVTFFYDPE